MRKLFDMDMSTVFRSTLGIPYPTLRDHPLHTAQKWLEGKQIDDGAEGFWRIDDSLYDLTDFIQNHPGGRDWIQLTKGIDITEAFESHHVTDEPRRLLDKYYLRKATKARNYPFTFKETGFYRTLKKRILKKLQTLPPNAKQRSKILTDALFVFYVSFFIMAVSLRSFTLGLVAGIFLGLTTVAAHNFFHQKDNFRRFYFDFSMMSSRDWRISHVLSHHIYTNTIHDLEISMLEPFLQYLPGKKHFIFRYGSWIASPFAYAIVFFMQFIRATIQNFVNGGKDLSVAHFLPFTVPLLSWLLTKESALLTILMFAWALVVGSTYFGLIGLNAGHHHPNVFHDGDASRPPEELDWGIHQIDAVMDREDITGSHFLVITCFGDHALHHLFPAIDHGVLEHLYPIFLETCEEFGIEWKLKSQIETIKGQFMQLKKVVGNSRPPKKLLKTG